MLAKIINCLNRRVLAKQCLPVFHHPLSLCYYFNPCQNSIGTRWMVVLCNYITQSVPNTGVIQRAPYQYCTHPKFHVSTVCTYVCIYIYIYIYIYICFNWANLPSSNLLQVPLTTQYKLYIITLKTLVWLE